MNTGLEHLEVNCSFKSKDWFNCLYVYVNFTLKQNPEILKNILTVFVHALKVIGTKQHWTPMTFNVWGGGVWCIFKQEIQRSLEQHKGKSIMKNLVVSALNKSLTWSNELMKGFLTCPSKQWFRASIVAPNFALDKM